MADIDWPEDPGPGGYETGAPAGETPPTSAATPPVPPVAGTGGPPPASDRGGVPERSPEPDEATRRYNELDSRFKTLETQLSERDGTIAYLRRLTNAALGREIDVPRAPTPDDERTQRIRDTMLRLFPELGQVRTLQEGRQQEEQERGRQADVFAKKALSRALDHVAKVTLGDGKTAKDLSPQSSQWAQKAFIDWVLMDKERTTAYNDGEMPDVAQFWTEYTRDMMSGSIRASHADVERRAGRIAALPSGGPSQAPVGTPPPDLNYLDEAAVHKAAYAAATAQR